MLYTDKYLQAHVLFRHKSFEQFCSEIPKFYFKKDVPADVVQNFEVVEKLLVFSYYEYKFIDEAYAKAIHTFEMAMSIKSKELNLQPLKKGFGFNLLMKALAAQNCFDSDIAVVDRVREMRNHFSHPGKHSFAGIVYWHNVKFISRLVNELYEDVPLRIDRRRLSNQFETCANKLDLDKFIVMKKGMDESVVLFNMALLWVNNKLSPCTYLMQCTPLFDLTWKTEYEINVPEILGIKIIDPVFTAKELKAIDAATGEAISFSSIADNPDQSQLFEKWRREYDSIPWNFLYERSIYTSSSEVLVPELQAFQEM